MFDDTEVADAMRHYVSESAPVLALRLDTRDCVTESNTEADRWFGGAPIGRPFAELLVPFTRPDDLPALVRQHDTPHPLTVGTAKGLPESVDFRFFPLPDGTLALGSPDFREQQVLREQVLGLNRELNNLTRALHLANAELAELNQLKNRFLGMAAHDLRKPVGVIMTYTEFVLDEAGPSLTTEQQGFLRTSLLAAAGMRQVIDNFLDLAVIESGQLRLELAHVGGAQILAGVEPLARLLADKKKITLLVDPIDPARRWRLDLGKIQQVLLNLLGNAIEHSSPGQRVWLSARSDDHQLVFAVRDEGPGLGPDAQARLFTAFGGGGPKKTAGERSTGLGLAIARLIVEALGGRLWVDSVLGQGATFFFSVPTSSGEHA
jgi:signal transduction histidine kinase